MENATKPDGSQSIKYEAPCGCKWYEDGTKYKCLDHLTPPGAPNRVGMQL